ncbi:hypothetical protein [Rhodococcus sp. 14-2470-1a]|uniref:hypothetical protein n=1 Tax=Rhodococcus sp. 14-2470-1a TaxID=2023150 RepID=UPI000B9AA994|nr:hypothetical protein [Rhodococcus sp. 14-2470-1a]OZF47569.1 hypothetical protein CH292_19285 [Rhodococcus sp. 14-2470-1a]
MTDQVTPTDGPQSQKIIVWTDKDGRKHSAAEGSFAHKAHLAEKEADAAVAADTADSDSAAFSDAASSDADAAASDPTPAQLTSTASGRPAGPPRAGSAKPS